MVRHKCHSLAISSSFFFSLSISISISRSIYFYIYAFCVFCTWRRNKTQSVFEQREEKSRQKHRKVIGILRYEVKMLNQAYLPFGFFPCLQHGFPLAYLFWWERFGLYLGDGYGIQNAQRSSKKAHPQRRGEEKTETSARNTNNTRKKKGTFTSLPFQPKAHFSINQWCETSVMFIICLY